FHVTGVQTCALPILRSLLCTLLRFKIYSKKQEVGIGTVNPDSIYKANVDFNLINGSPDAHLTAFLWRSKFEITWNNEPVLLRYYGNKQQIGNSSVTLQMERKSFSMGDLILTGEDSDF